MQLNLGNMDVPGGLQGMGQLGRQRRGCSNPFGGIIAGFVFIAVGIGAFFLLGGTLREALDSSSWPTAQGEVTQSQVEQTRDREGDIMYRPNVSYTYTVDGQTYTGVAITLLDGSTSVRSSVQNTVERYRAGSSVTVYYSPTDPSYAVLEPGIQGGMLALGAFIVCFPLAGLLAIVGSIGRLFSLGGLLGLGRPG